MSSLFDTAVHNRRNHTPWAHVNAFQFMKEMAWNGEGNPYERAAKLSVHFRNDVASGFWWTIEWMSEDGERHAQSAQELDLCLWRAAEAEMKIRERLELERQKAKSERTDP